MNKLLMTALITVSLNSFTPVFSNTTINANTTCNPDAAKIDALIERLLVSSKLLETINESLWAPYQQQIATLPAEQAAILKKAMDKISTFIRSEKMINTFKEIYKKHFTLEDVQAVVDFYESAVGKKMLTKTPEIMTDVFNILMPTMQELNQELMLELQALEAAQTKTCEQVTA